ncbi:Abi family protein, partial [Escherichia coli]|uniref:Abi family protein n=1 Tax=Escherichia coli TaxID=562 RepID=UPI00225ACBF1
MSTLTITKKRCGMDDIVKLISEKRLGIYEDYFSCLSTSEALGVYLWNQKVASEFSCIIQIIEISLRNSIYSAYLENKSSDAEWFIKHSEALDTSNEGRRQIDYVKNQLSKKLSYNVNDVISRLPFGYWASMCRSEHDESVVGSLELWPSLIPFVFKGRSAESQAEIFDLIVKVNKMRNRISHNEVIWKDIVGLGVSSVFNKIFNSYTTCIKLSKVIGVDNLKLIEMLESIKNLKELCSNEKVEEYKRIFDGWQNINPCDENAFVDSYFNVEVGDGVITKKTASRITIQSRSCLDKQGKQLRFSMDRTQLSEFSSTPIGTPVKFTPYVYRLASGKLYVAKSVS